jgi:D-xylose transport system permease protein
MTTPTTTPPSNPAPPPSPDGPGADDTPMSLAVQDPALSSTFGEYVRAWGKRMRNGESGVLPVVLGLIILVVIFQVQDSVFLSAGNLTNLMVQGAVFVLLGMAEVWLLILGEIDLSVGYNAGVGGVIAAILVSAPHNFPWWAAIIVAMLATTALGMLWGILVVKFGVPSFVVTLGGLLGLEGLLIYLVQTHGSGGTIPITNSVLLDLSNGNLSTTAGWIIMVVGVAAFAATTFLRDRHRRRSGLVAPPIAVTVMKVVAMAGASVVLVLICNTNRGALAPLRGVPYVVLIILGFLALYTFMLTRMRFGRYLYAIGGNAEGARRAGVSLGWNRFWAFALTGATAGAAGILYASRLGSISNNVDGGTLVLYAVAAAVIGGASLFGGRGKMIHALLGGIVIATIYNGMGLLGLAADYQFMVTALVLLAAVIIDALARRGRTAG